jgi:hypothetical protein
LRKKLAAVHGHLIIFVDGCAVVVRGRHREAIQRASAEDDGKAIVVVIHKVCGIVTGQIAAENRFMRVEISNFRVGRAIPGVSAAQRNKSQVNRLFGSPSPCGVDESWSGLYTPPAM